MNENESLLGVKVLGNKLLIKPNKSEEQTESGIILTKESQEKKVSGIVLNKGELSNPEIKVGDNVVYDKYSVTEIKIKEEIYVVIEDINVIMILL